MGQLYKERICLGANSFPEEWTPFQELHPPDRQTGICIVPLCKTDGKHGSQYNITSENEQGMLKIYSLRLVM